MKSALKRNLIIAFAGILIVVGFVVLSIYLGTKAAYESTGGIEYAYKAQLMGSAMRILIFAYPMIMLTKCIANFIVKHKATSVVGTIAMAIVIFLINNNVNIFDNHTIEKEKIKEIDRLIALKEDYENKETIKIKNAIIEFKTFTKNQGTENEKDEKYISINNGKYLIPFEKSYIMDGLIKENGNEVEVYENSKFIASINNVDIYPKDKYGNEYEYKYLLVADVNNKLFMIEYETGRFVSIASAPEKLIIQYSNMDGKKIKANSAGTNQILSALKNGEYAIEVINVNTGEPVTAPLYYSAINGQIKNIGR